MILAGQAAEHDPGSFSLVCGASSSLLLSIFGRSAVGIFVSREVQVFMLRAVLVWDFHKGLASKHCGLRCSVQPRPWRYLPKLCWKLERSEILVKKVRWNVAPKNAGPQQVMRLSIAIHIFHWRISGITWAATSKATLRVWQFQLWCNYEISLETIAPAAPRTFYSRCGNQKVSNLNRLEEILFWRNLRKALLM